MNVLSLFDGISCGRVALDRAGIKYDNYYASEIDKYAIQVAMKNYPDIIQVGDVTKLNSESLPKIDLLIGGSPCQGFSFAGKGLNFGDPRSKLFFEFARLKDELNPKYWLLENVKMKNEYQDIINNILGVNGIIINSKLVSAQSRVRQYWTNIKFDEIEDKGILLQDILEFGKTDRNKSKTIRVGGVKSGWGNKHEWDMPNKDRVYTRNEMERLQTLPDNYTQCVSVNHASKMLGNGWTVDVISHIFKNIT